MPGRRPLLPPFWGRGHFTMGKNAPLPAKTCFRKCRAANAVGSDAGAANVVAAVDNALPDPTPAVTPSGKPHYKNAGSTAHAAPRTSHNNPAAHTAGPRLFCRSLLGAGPRAPPLRQLTPPRHVRAVAADNAAPAPAGGYAPRHWPDNAGSPAHAATDVLPADSRRCNTAPADASAGKAAHNPSANNDDYVATARPLVRRTRADAMESDPRETSLPTVKSRSQAQTWLRGVLHWEWFRSA